jgi:hypothetical protein
MILKTPPTSSPGFVIGIFLIDVGIHGRVYQPRVLRPICSGNILCARVSRCPNILRLNKAVFFNTLRRNPITNTPIWPGVFLKPNPRQTRHSSHDPQGQGQCPRVVVSGVIEGVVVSDTDPRCNRRLDGLHPPTALVCQ